MAAPDRRILAAFVLVVVIGGTNLVLVVVTARKLEPFWAAGLRFVGAAILTWVVMAALRLTAPRGRALTIAAVYGVLGFFLGFGLFFWATQQVPAGIASVIFGCVPLLTFLLAVLHRLERFRVRGLLGACLAIGGIAVISVEDPSGSPPVLPLLAVVGAAVATAEAALTVRRIPNEHPLSVNAVGMSVGAVLLLLTSAVRSEPHEAPWAAGAALPLLVMIVTSPLLFCAVCRGGPAMVRVRGRVSVGVVPSRIHPAVGDPARRVHLGIPAARCPAGDTGRLRRCLGTGSPTGRSLQSSVGSRARAVHPAVASRDGFRACATHPLDPPLSLHVDLIGTIDGP